MPLQMAIDNASEGTGEHHARAEQGKASLRPGELLLLREMTHRINNELTSMIGMVSVAAARSTSSATKLALVKVIERLNDQARLYRVLQMPAETRFVDATEFLRALCQAISRAKLQTSGIELVLVEHPIRLTSRQCWRLGMIISELITNSYRHAFGDGRGTIRVELKKCGTYAECRVSDDGCSSDIVRSGHGHDIIRQLASTLDGEIDLRFGQDGAVAVLSFPIASRMRDGPVITSNL
jgi:two-component sensor histidine kinase